MTATSDNFTMGSKTRELSSASISTSKTLLSEDMFFLGVVWKNLEPEFLNEKLSFSVKQINYFNRGLL